MIGRTAQLSFHAVEGPGTGKPETGEPAYGDSETEGTDGRKKPSASDTGPGDLTLPDEQGRSLALGPSRLSGAGVDDATAAFDAQGGA